MLLSHPERGTNPATSPLLTSSLQNPEAMHVKPSRLWYFVSAALAHQYKWFSYFQAAENTIKECYFLTWKLYELTFRWIQSHSFLHSLWLLLCCRGRAEQLHETIWPKIFPLLPFTEKSPSLRITTTSMSQSITLQCVQRQEEGEPVTIFHLSFSCSSVSCFSSKN